jgi:hypothetical protein
MFPVQFLVLYSRPDVTLLPHHRGERDSVPWEEGRPQVRGRESSELQGEKPAVLGCPPSESREQTSRNTEGENVSVS